MTYLVFSKSDLLTFLNAYYKNQISQFYCHRQDRTPRLWRTILIKSIVVESTRGKRQYKQILYIQHFTIKIKELICMSFY